MLATRPYARPENTFDEPYDSAGNPKPHWREFIQMFDGFGAEEQSRRWEGARRMIREHGITYNLFGDPDGMERPWELDPIPYIVSPEDWQLLQSGVAQRAKLLNRLLSDIYGPRLFLRNKLIPPAILFANPCYYRACSNIQPEDHAYIHLYAVDLFRASDGVWRVIADRTETPFGLGYLLENRIILSHTLADLFQSCQVWRLAAFYKNLSSALKSGSPVNRENPNIVVLSSGPASQTYFEHAYLSRYLGFKLVETEDLTVRDNTVFLKTIGGMSRVDVIFRYVPTSGIDPLMLQHDRPAGIPGLLEAVQAGNVLVSNALGSGVVETPALLPFLPDLCKAAVNETLILPSAPVRWCGDGQPLDEIINNPDDWLIRSAFSYELGGVSTKSEHGHRDRASSGADLTLQPAKYIALQRQDFPTIPAWEFGSYRPKRMLLRMYAVAAGNGYTVLPGGLTLVAESNEHLLASGEQPGGSKDTWVLSPGPVKPHVSAGFNDKAVAISRKDELPSRVADDLFWLGRYLERTEFYLRLLRTTASRISPHAEIESYSELPALLEALARHRLIDGSLATNFKTGDISLVEEAIVGCVFDAEGQETLRGTVDSTFAAASRVRDRLSMDAWRIVSRLGNGGIRSGGGRIFRMSEALDLLNELNLTLSAFSGIAMETMTRGLGWQFLDIGRRLERAHNTALLIHALIPARGDIERAVLEAVLEVAASLMTFRARYRSTIQTGPAMDLIINDESNPRSIAFQIAEVAEHLHTLPQVERVKPYGTTEERIVLSLLTSIRLADPSELCAVDDQGMRPQLGKLLAEIKEKTLAMSDNLTLHYMAHVETSQHLVLQSSGDGR